MMLLNICPDVTDVSIYRIQLHTTHAFTNPEMLLPLNKIKAQFKV